MTTSEAAEDLSFVGAGAGASPKDTSTSSPPQNGAVSPPPGTGFMGQQQLHVEG